MRTKEFLSRLEHDRIVGAIREAESKTSSQIRVYVQRGKLSADSLIAAQKKFQRLGMHKTRERNAVLIFVAPRAHKFAVVGDKAIHEKCGEQFWQHLVDGMRGHFQNEKFSCALGRRNPAKKDISDFGFLDFGLAFRFLLSAFRF